MVRVKGELSRKVNEFLEVNGERRKGRHREEII